MTGVPPGPLRLCTPLLATHKILNKERMFKNNLTFNSDSLLVRAEVYQHFVQQAKEIVVFR